MVPSRPSTDGAENTEPRAASCEESWLKVLLRAKAFAEACHVAGPPAGSNGKVPAAGRTRMATDDGGLASKLSTRPAGGLS